MRGIHVNLVTVVASTLLWGVFSLSLVGPLALGLVAAICAAFAMLVIRGRIDSLGVFVIANYTLWLLSGFLVHSLVLSDLTKAAFWNGDGRIFVYYIPLLFFAVATARRRDLTAIVNALVVMAWLGLALYVVFTITHWSFLSGTGVGGRGGVHGGNFYGLLTSHTGSGTFWGALAVFLLVFGMAASRQRTLLAGVAALFPMIGSASRQAMLALAVALAWYLLRNAKTAVRIRAAGVGVAIALLVPVVAPHTYERTVRIMNVETLRAAVQTVNTARWEPGRAREIEGAEFNVLSRMLFWGYAVRRFVESPWIGMGWGRFNDIGVRMTGIAGVFYVATEGVVLHSVLSAHNSYLHTLCEVGVLGLTLLLGLWATLWRRLRRGTYLLFFDNTSRSYCIASQALVIFTLVGALVAHGLASPSVGLVVLTIVGAGVSVLRRASMPYAAELAISATRDDQSILHE